ncbi:hypothetical protein [Streptomyces sp. NBC_00162]|uniref:hypothetical protein n=1 Tax=Streptomyces sp. NBC_00162 TaxID=2903629 RepID=UPI00214CEA9F|nr:hypothetical protein [Streptomyces sp. NBC_00162]UUU44311.1 hypothetical protein JIW86_39580 [Streptomyces sp. NBC_00162]
MTTEQLAHAGGGEPQQVYPGEATADDTREEDRDEMRQKADVTDTEAAAEETPAAEGKGTASVPPEEAEALLPEREAAEYQKTWGEIQARFVDDPQGAVRDADGLVAEVMQTLAGTFSEHKRELESQWQSGEQVATEDLRLALQKYRSFFGRLLRT